MNKIYTYALIKSLYDKQQNYIDTFWPLVVNSLPLNHYGLNVDKLQLAIQQKFSISIPIYSLKTIANRASERGFIKKNFKTYYLTKEGVSYLDDIESEPIQNRRINELLNDACRYLFQTHEIKLSEDEIKVLIERIIRENIELFDCFIEDTEEHEREVKTLPESYDNAIIDYFYHIEKYTPQIFKTLQDIVYGSIISTVVQGSTLIDHEKKLNDIIIFLDSNITFSLLELHYPEINKPVLELFQLMQSQSNLKFRVFDFTIQEMVNLLRQYHTEGMEYPVNIKVDSIFSSMKQKGYESSDLKALTANIHEKLNKLGIEIENTKLDLKKHNVEDLDRVSELLKYKPNQPSSGQNHDLLAIDLIKKKRNSVKRKIEECQCMFLSSDHGLSKFNYFFDGHKDNETIANFFLVLVSNSVLYIVYSL